ncbi:MAG: ABC transporter ATP-binding protein [Campylobacteraceae bacterium]|nr:ABC transporter ATP-binding protein [Campylobacteraceae bacterium]
MSMLYELNNVKKSYDGREVLNIKYLILESNQIIGFFGPNGSGKSTLFSLLSMIDKACSGEILFENKCIKKLNLKTRQDIIIVPQNPYLLKRTVYENVSFALKLRKDTKNLEKRVFDALKQVGLDKSFSKRKWSQLSGGEAQRVALAARLILKPKVLILDEPTVGVDTTSAQLIKEAILQAKEKYNTTIFISSHDHTWLNHICDKKVALFQGKIVQSGNVNLLFAPWHKDLDGNLVKVFLDGQKLIIQNSQEKKRDSVMMINSDHIVINKVESNTRTSPTTLIGQVSSIHKEQNEEKLLVEFSIGGVCLNAKLSVEEIQNQNLLPGSKINVTIDTSKACWI